MFDRCVPAFFPERDVLESIKAEVDGFFVFVVVVVDVHHQSDVSDDASEFRLSDFRNPSWCAMFRFFEYFDSCGMMLSFESDVFVFRYLIVEVDFVEEHSDAVTNPSSEALFEIFVIDVVGCFIFVTIEDDIVVVSDVMSAVVVDGSKIISNIICDIVG